MSFERVALVEYAGQIWSMYLLVFKSYGRGLGLFCHKVKEPHTDRQTDRTKSRCPGIPFCGHKNGLYIQYIVDKNNIGISFPIFNWDIKFYHINQVSIYLLVFKSYGRGLGLFCHKVKEPQTDRQTEQKVDAQEFHSAGIKMVFIFSTLLIKII